MSQKETGWAHRRVAVLGGDVREHYVVGAYRDLGCEVTTFGIAPGSDHGDLASADAATAVNDAEVVVCPVPGIGAGDVLYAPHAPTPIVMDEELLAHAAFGAVFFSGRATPTIEQAGVRNGVRFVHLYDDDVLQYEHALPTAEGAIARTVTSTVFTIAHSEILVSGYGRIGKILAERLRGMGARVTIAARGGDARALARGLGCRAIDLADLLAHVGDFDIIYNTAPALLFDESVLKRVPRTTFLLDLAAPPGGIDRDAAERLGVHHDWARGQAGTAPQHSGLSQFESMSRSLDELYGRSAGA